MCQNNYISCCFLFFHITWASTSGSLEWMKGGLFFFLPWEGCSESKTYLNKGSFLPTQHKLILRSVWDLFVPLFSQWIGNLTGRNISYTNVLVLKCIWLC